MSKFPNTYDSGSTDIEIQNTLTPFTEEDYKNHDIQKFSINRENLIKFVAKQQTLIKNFFEDWKKVMFKSIFLRI